MKNVMKKVLCAVMLLSLIMTAMPAAFAAEDLVLLDANFNDLADGVRTSLSSSDFYHVEYDYSGTGACGNNKNVTQLGGISTEAHKFVSTTIGASGYGRNGKSFIYNVNEATASETYSYDFKWTPEVHATDSTGKTNMQVTYEFSLRAPENVGDGFVQYDVMLPVDGYKSLVSLQAKTNGANVIYAWDKTDGNSWRTMCNWEPGQWYNIAVVFTPGTNKLDYYLNGELIYNGIYSKNYDRVGGRFRLVYKVTSVPTGRTYTSTMASDDVRICTGTPNFTEFSTDISSNVYRIVNDTIYVDPNNSDYDSVVNGISVANGGSVEIYTDSTYSTVAESVTEGCKLVATSKNGRVLGYYNIAEEGDILNCDMETSFGIAENAMPSYEGTLVGANNTGKGSIGTAGSFPNYAKGNVKSAGAGKDGYAYFVDVNNTTEETAKPGIDFKFLPNVTSGKVTVEFSMLAPESYDTIRPALYVPYNADIEPLFSFQPDGKLGVNNKYICQWVPGRWYNFAVEMTVGSETADFYLNGDKVLDDEVIYTLINDEGNVEKAIEYIGGRLRFEVAAPAGISDVTAFDDVKVYTGEYEAALNEVLVESNVEDYSVSEYGYIFTPDSSVRVNSLKNYISGTFAVYEDDTFENTASYTGEGQVLVATSENGNVVKYYTLVPDGKIAVTVNDSATTELSSRETVTIGAMANLENAYVFAASYDAEGNFIGADLVSANGATNKPAKVSFNTKAGEIVKLMLWDKTSLKPVGDMVTIQK